MPVLNDPTPQAGVAVTALTGGIADADGLPACRSRSAGSSRTAPPWNAIAGATAATFTPGAPQVGNRLRVVVSFTDTNGTAESVTSAASAEVVAAGAGPAPGGGPGQGIGLGQTAAPVAPCRCPRARSPPRAAGRRPAARRRGPGARLRPGRRPRAVGPITVAANVPAGASVVRIRVFRAGGRRGTAKARAAAARGRLVATVFRPAPVAKRYRFRLTEREAAAPVRRALPGRGPRRPQPLGARAAGERGR